MIDGYETAYSDAVFFIRGSRRLLEVTGKAPTSMLSGLLSGSVPPDLASSGDDTLRGRAPYSAMLTAKGRMVSDLRVSRLGNGEEGALLLDLPEAGLPGALTHFRKYLPPRMARVTELGASAGVLTVVGPAAAHALGGASLPLPVDEVELSGLAEGDERVVPDGTETGVRVIRDGDVIPPAFDVIADQATLTSHSSRLRDAGMPEGKEDLWQLLRLERGRPAFGVEMDEETIPMEAGIQHRCIDNSKGCYTGQEVIVRIRDRGHVNRHLRGILLGDAPLPEPGTLLFPNGDEKAVGVVRSSASSPRFGQGIALAYVRREIQPPSSLALGTPDGPNVMARELTDAGWLLVDGDPSPYP